MATNSIEECRQIRRQLERERQRERRASLTTRQGDRRASLTTEQYRQKERERQRERDVPALQQNKETWIDQVIVNNAGKCVRDELQKKESNIDRQTVKKDNHDHNNLLSYQCIKYFTKLTKIFLHLITASANAYYIGKTIA